MNEMGVASVNAIIRELPFGIPDDLLLLSIFGSQVKGTERPDSDLDVLFVVRTSEASPYDTVRDAITKTPGGVTGATIIPHTPDTITWTANVYGTVEWGVLREDGARTLYRSADFDVKLHTDINYDYSAGRWLDMARKDIFPEMDRSESRPGSACFWTYLAACNLLRAALLSAGMTFPFTRDIRVLYGMLSPDRRPPLDVDTVEAIRERYDKDRDDKNWSRDDVRAARNMVKPAYRFANRMIKPVGRLATPDDRPMRAPVVRTPAGSLAERDHHRLGLRRYST